MRLFIEPTEPLLFRTAHPFIAGENNFASSYFPPTPETLQGAMRAAIATHWDKNKTLEEAFQDKELVKLIGQYTNYGQFRITGTTLGRHKKKEESKYESLEPLFPRPVHILQEGEKKRQVRLTPRKKEDPKIVDTNLPTDMQLLYPDRVLEKPEKLEPIKKAWLTRRGLEKALFSKDDLRIADRETADREEETEGIRDEYIFTFESRLGIGMNNKTKTTEEGFLYQVQMIRMNHRMNSPFTYGFILDIRLAQSSEERRTSFSAEALIDDSQTQERLRLPDQGWITLGGERRAARFEVITSSKVRQQDGARREERGNLLYFATPAAFSRGWQPKEWREPLTKPIAVAIDRYQPIGGWLLTPENSGGQSKTMRRCVPAGTVYFFDKPVTLAGSLTDYGWQIGYGIAYAGEW